MKKLIVCFVVLILFSVSVFAAGGAGPFLASFCLDPRAGYMINDNDSSWTTPVILNLVFTPGLAIYACTESGAGAGFGGLCLGGLTPTGWVQLKDYKIRTKEWCRLVPVYGLILHVMDAIDASKGVTWSEIVEQEGLKK